MNAMVQVVSDVEKASEKCEGQPCLEVFSWLVDSPVHRCSRPVGDGRLVNPGFHSFVGAVHAAYAQHYPLVLSPDMFWLLITQGLARHIDQHSEEMRRQFVDHDGKKELVVRRDDFVKDPAENPWEEVIGEFSERIREHIGERNHAALVTNFSTTGQTERVANEVVLMSAMQHYFDFLGKTICGIPEVTLEGTVADWERLCRRAADIGSEYDVGRWTDRMLPTLERIAANAAGKDDPDLWKNIYKEHQDLSCGGPHFDGWLLDFFPYLDVVTGAAPPDAEAVDGDRRQFSDPGMGIFQCEKKPVPNWGWDKDSNRKVTIEDLPNGLCVAPLVWKFFAEEIPMAFAAGFAGMTQDPSTLALRPNIGWAVCDPI